MMTCDICGAEMDRGEATTLRDEYQSMKVKEVCDGCRTALDQSANECHRRASAELAACVTVAIANLVAKSVR